MEPRKKGGGEGTQNVITKTVVCEVAKDTYIIDMFGEQSPALLVGTEKALLIDTACGDYDLAGLVQKLTDKPLTVVLTHGHGDHAGGAFQFETVWCHPLDHTMVQNWTTACGRVLRDHEAK